MDAIEWIEYGESFRTFHNEGLCKPGVQIRIVYDGRDIDYLIGDINDMGGSCDHCQGNVDDYDIVAHYRVLAL